MGVDHNIYIGAFLAIDVGRKKVRSQDLFCPEHGRKLGEFCNSCGAVLQQSNEFEEYTESLFNILPDEFEDFLREGMDQMADHGSPIIYAIGNLVGDSDTFIDERLPMVEITKEMVEFSMKKFEEVYKGVIDYFAKKYSVKVMFGYLHWYS